MNVWVQFAVAVVFIGVSVVLGVLMIVEPCDAAQHELVVDALWDDEGAA